MDFRKIFDSIPEEFDKWRTRYCPELFKDLIDYSQLDSTKTALEVGPGTGQATEPILKTGCLYQTIELGENFTDYMKEKFKNYPNFSIINDDFETYDFGEKKFDLIYSAAAFQWIPEKIGYPKAFDLLKSGGTFAMFVKRDDIRPSGGYTDDPLYSQIQNVYKQYFHPITTYSCKLDYDVRDKYGFIGLETREYPKTRKYNADDFVSHISTHADHINLLEPDKSRFHEGIRKVIIDAGNKITLYDKYVIYLAKKP